MQSGHQDKRNSVRHLPKNITRLNPASIGARATDAHKNEPIDEMTCPDYASNTRFSILIQHVLIQNLNSGIRYSNSKNWESRYMDI